MDEDEKRIARSVDKIRMDFLPGTDIKDAMTQAWHYQCKHSCEVVFDFNGAEITIVDKER